MAEYEIYRCGYCVGKRKSGTRGDLIPVIIISGGREREGWSHIHCLPKWKRISEVHLNENYKDKEMVLHSQKRINRIAEWGGALTRAFFRGKKGKRCVDCGYPITPQSKRCMTCAGAERARQNPRKQYFCVCGEKVSGKNRLCKNCAPIRRERNRFIERFGGNHESLQQKQEA